MYTPFLFFVIFLTVQASLFFLGNQAASAAARESARVARADGASPATFDQARQRGLDYAASVGHGVIEKVQVQVELVDGQVRATVTGRGIQLVPGIPGGDITQVVQSPIEQFRPDLPAGGDL